ncbi:MAG: response regulator, partial [Aestuariivirgaceae bacterium]|nr:response regulator [Aestuariivirgaceae bacterium]
MRQPITFIETDPMASRILIIEDEPAQRRILEEMVKRFGFDVISAENGLRGLEILGGPQGNA